MATIGAFIKLSGKPLLVAHIDLDDFKTGWNSCFDMLMSTVEATPIIQVAGEKMAQMAPARAIPQNFLFRANIPPMIAITAITKRGKISIETFVAEMKGLSSPKYPVTINFFNIARTASQPDRCSEPAMILRTPPATAFQGLSTLIFPLIVNGDMWISRTPIPHLIATGCTKLYTIGNVRTSSIQFCVQFRCIFWYNRISPTVYIFSCARLTGVFIPIRMNTGVQLSFLGCRSG